MTIDTGNSSFPTLLAVFTYNGVLSSYTNLNPVACDNNSNGTGTNTSSVQFNAATGANYFIVVGGVNGARGVAYLNYSLNADPPPTPPSLTNQPQPFLVATQTAVTLSVVANGTAPFVYQWWKDNSQLRQQTNATLLLRSPQNRDSGNYSVVVTNIAGSITSAPANVTVISSPLVNLNAGSNQMVSAFPGIRGYQYSADCNTGLVAGAWNYWTNAYPDFGGVVWLTNSTTGNSALFLRVHTP
jgi:hypothetical protein